MWIYLWVPETKQLTLEELDAVFSVPTATFSRYEVGTVLPWWFRCYILRQKDAYLAPLVVPADRVNGPGAGHGGVTIKTSAA